jgi:2-polyprenyl-3-methyl-5-hydroxy-6-metoxy-1,4-benzoquinol methylase
VSGLLDRLAGAAVEKRRDPTFQAFVFDDPSDRERPEITRHIPPAARRLLDVGCGAAGSSAALKHRIEGLCAFGIESDARAAQRACARLDRVLLGNAPRALEDLAAEGRSFDAFLFADVLEHLEDPVAALRLGRALAAPGATLVASVPNAGHLSLVRDLVRGRFDPVPAGLADAGHLRWFTRASLGEALEEAGWRVLSIEAWPGAPVSESTDFLARLEGWPGLDRESLGTYQWIAVANTDLRP